MIGSQPLLAALSALVLATTQEVNGRSIFRRDGSNVPPERTLDMPLVFDGRGRYTLPVSMVREPLLNGQSGVIDKAA